MVIRESHIMQLIQNTIAVLDSKCASKRMQVQLKPCYLVNFSMKFIH